MIKKGANLVYTRSNKHYVLLLLVIGFFIPSFAQNLPPETEAHIQSLPNSEKIKYLGDLCWSLRDKNNAEAIQCGQYAVELADSIGLFGEAARISNYLGVNMLYYRYDTKQAWHYFRYALSYGLKSQDSTQIGYAYDNIGYLYLIHGDVSNAFNNIILAENIFSELNDEQGLAYIYSNLGLVHQANKDYESAFNYFFRAKTIHIRNNNKIGIAAILSCIGDTYVLQNKRDSALVSFQKQLEISEKNANQKYIAQALKGISKVRYLQGNYTEALDIINRALELSIEKEDYLQLIEIRINKALIFSKTGLPDQGEKELQEALELATRLQFPKSVYDICMGYAEFYNSVGFNEQSAATFKELFERYNSMYKMLQKETIINENQKLQAYQNLEKAQNEILTDKKLHNLYYVIFFLMAVILAGFVWRFSSIKKLNQKLHQKNKEIVLEIEQKNRAMEALEKSEKDLKTSNSSKDKLFSIISHDLRSPFHSMLGFSRILCEEQKSQSESKRKEIAELLYDTAENAYNLLDNLLAWAGSQTNRISYYPDLLSVKTMVNENVQLHKMAAKNKNINLSIISGDNCKAFADEEMVHIILRNLISNAIKFTPEKGEIKVSWNCDLEKESIKISVEDSGTGISPDEQKKLFEQAHLKSSPGTQNEKGTGLGLSLCKEFVEKQGGNLSLTSEVGKGSIFSFTLPASQPKK